MTAKEASMYEPRVGDLVSVFGFRSARICRAKDGEGFVHTTEEDRYGGTVRRLWTRSNISPLRPDAPGQRVRGCVGGVFSAGVTREAMHDPLRDCNCSGFYVAWDAGGGGPWSIDRLIRIADQAPAVQVEAPCPETPADVCAAVYGFTPGSVQFVTGPTCQHCGSNVIAGLLRDTCPRGCDLTLRAEEPEPQTWKRPKFCPGGIEWVWCAGERAEHHPFWSHPTREGAIAAWREAVRR